MKAIVLFYSYSGHTQKAAQKLARTQEADLVEVKTLKRHSKPYLFTVECMRALLGKSAAIEPIPNDLKQYDMITLAAPVWASNPAPAFNAMVKLLPKGKNVQVILVSSSGAGATKRSEPKIRKSIREQGCTVVAYKDVKQS